MSEVHRCIPYRRDHGARLRKLAETYPVIAEVRGRGACFLLEGTHVLYGVPHRLIRRVQVKGHREWDKVSEPREGGTPIRKAAPRFEASADWAGWG